MDGVEAPGGVGGGDGGGLGDRGAGARTDAAAAAGASLSSAAAFFFDFFDLAAWTNTAVTASSGAADVVVAATVGVGGLPMAFIALTRIASARRALAESARSKTGRPPPPVLLAAAAVFFALAAASAGEAEAAAAVRAARSNRRSAAMSCADGCAAHPTHPSIAVLSNVTTTGPTEKREVVSSNSLVVCITAAVGLLVSRARCSILWEFGLGLEVRVGFAPGG